MACFGPALARVAILLAHEPLNGPGNIKDCRGFESNLPQSSKLAGPGDPRLGRFDSFAASWLEIMGFWPIRVSSRFGLISELCPQFVPSVTSAWRMSAATGHVFRREGARGPVWYAKYRLQSGRQVQRRIGPAWTQRGRPASGYFTKRTAQDWPRGVLDEARRGTLPGMVRTGATLSHGRRVVEVLRARARGEALDAHRVPALGGSDRPQLRRRRACLLLLTAMPAP